MTFIVTLPVSANQQELINDDQPVGNTGYADLNIDWLDNDHHIYYIIVLVHWYKYSLYHNVYRIFFINTKISFTNKPFHLIRKIPEITDLQRSLQVSDGESSKKTGRSALFRSQCWHFRWGIKFKLKVSTIIRHLFSELCNYRIRQCGQGLTHVTSKYLNKID